MSNTQLNSEDVAEREQTPPPPADPDLRLARHRAQCHICRHPEREAIERQFLDWTTPKELAESFNLGSERALYRHAHALGLFDRRRINMLGALDCVIERVRQVNVTASAVIAAIRLSIELQRELGNAFGPSCAPGSPATLSSRAARQFRPRFALSLEGLPRTDALEPNPKKQPESAPAPATPAAPATTVPVSAAQPAGESSPAAPDPKPAPAVVGNIQLSPHHVDFLLPPGGLPRPQKKRFFRYARWHRAPPP